MRTFRLAHSAVTFKEIWIARYEVVAEGIENVPDGYTPSVLVFRITARENDDNFKPGTRLKFVQSNLTSVPKEAAAMFRVVQLTQLTTPERNDYPFEDRFEVVSIRTPKPKQGFVESDPTVPSTMAYTQSPLIRSPFQPTPWNPPSQTK